MSENMNSVRQVAFRDREIGESFSIWTGSEWVVVVKVRGFMVEDSEGDRTTVPGWWMTESLEDIG